MRKRKGLWESGERGAERAVKAQCLWKGGTIDGDKERRKGQDEGRGRDELGHLCEPEAAGKQPLRREGEGKREGASQAAR